VDLEAERRLQQFLIAAIQAGVITSAHDLSEGGLAVALAEACMGGPYADQCLGARLDLTEYTPGMEAGALLFAEDHGRAVISLPFARRNKLARLARDHGVSLFGAGRVTGPADPLEIVFGDRAWAWDVKHLRRVYMEAIPRRMARVATSAGEGE
jgi:phosphoribosylformylglycinamidine synthase